MESKTVEKQEFNQDIFDKKTGEDIVRRYPEDYRFAQDLISKHPPALERFRGELNIKLKSYLDSKYLSLFSDADAEEIFDAVMDRLFTERLGNGTRVWNPRVLKRYRGDCTLSRYVTRQVEWAVKQWLRDHQDEHIANTRNAASDESKYEKPDSEPHIAAIKDWKIPEYISIMPDDIRWTFLLWCYDLFGFPSPELEKLALKREMSVKDLNAIIDKSFFLDDVLSKKRIKREKQLDHLSRYEAELERLKKKSETILSTIDRLPDSATKRKMDYQQQVALISTQILEASQKCDQIKSDLKGLITTPYKTIGAILGVTNENTLRYRIYKAKEQIDKYRESQNENKSSK